MKRMENGNNSGTKLQRWDTNIILMLHPMSLSLMLRKMNGLRGMQKMKEARYITMLYTRLILIVVNLQIINRVQSLISKQTNYPDAILSDTKTLNTLRTKFSDILSILRDSLQKAVKILWKLYDTFRKNHWREKRKNRENFIENIYLFICTSEK